MRRVIGALAAAVLLAGCGAGEARQANRYVDAVNRAQSQFARTMSGLSGRLGSGSDPVAATRVLRAFDGALQRVVVSLRAIKPPARVAALHRRLVGDLDAYGAEVRRETEALRSGDSRALVAAQQRLLAATRRVSSQINTTLAAINRQLRSA
jgi:hypothetical protein